MVFSLSELYDKRGIGIAVAEAQRLNKKIKFSRVKNTGLFFHN